MPPPGLLPSLRAEDCLILDGVTTTFGGLVAVSDVSLVVRHRERRAIIGPNGAGKTTLFNTITGVVSPARGRVYFLGRDVTALAVYARAGLGMARTFQDSRLFPELTAEDSLLIAALGASPRKVLLHRPLSSFPEARGQAAAILDRLRLAHRDRRIPTKYLPHGTLRRIELAVALVSSPRLLLLDEPTAGLSRAEARSLSEILEDLVAHASTALMLIEHDMEIAFRLAETITVLNHGAILAEGTPEAIRADPEVRRVYLGT